MEAREGGVVRKKKSRVMKGAVSTERWKGQLLGV